MAKETLILTPYGVNGSGIRMFQYSYYDTAKRKQINFLVNGTIYEGSLANGKDPASHKEEKKVFFDAKILRYTLEYDTDDKSSSEYQEAKFILNHPNVQNASGNQNPNFTGKAMWIVELVHQKLEHTYSHMIQFLKAQNEFLAMSPMEWRECAFHFGLNPTNKGPHELAAELVGHKSGIIISSLEKCDDFFKWKSTYHSDDPKFVSEKATALGIIRKDNEVYKFDGIPMGRTIDEVSAALSVDRTTLRQVVKDIETSDSDLAEYIEKLNRYFPGWDSKDRNSSPLAIEPSDKPVENKIAAAKLKQTIKA
jgi:hypothetical protein